jgi:sugar/nucleoside kinase (ribokinase family)
MLPMGTVPYLGGSASNTAYFLSLLLPHANFQVELVSLIGNDQIGQYIQNLLDQKPYGHKFVKKWEGQTGSTTISLDQKGERSIIRHPSVISNLPQYIHDPKIRRILQGKKIHMKGSLNLWNAVINAESNLFSLDISGILKNSLNPQELRNTFHEGSTTILFGNETELMELSQQLALSSNEQTDLAREIMQIFSSKIVCIKRGEKGAIAVTQQESVSCPALRVKVKDSTGAGDAFNAGFLVGYLLGYSVKKCLEIGCTLGSLNCTVYGGQELGINLQELQSFALKKE